MDSTTTSIDGLLPDAIVGCEGCGEEVTVPANATNASGYEDDCPLCGWPLWEDDELPAPIETFVEKLP